MKKYDIIAFDLDGTLTDPSHGLIEGYLYAFKKMGITGYGSRESLRRFIGPPILYEWQREFSLTDEEAERTLSYFREYYNIYGWWDNKPYDGIRELLEALRAAGKRITLATSKPEAIAKKILSIFDLDKYFDFIGAAGADRVRDRKCDVLSYALDSMGADRSRAILVGDRKYDAEGAQLCGIDSMAALWGHGSDEEISAACFTLTASTPRAAARLLLGE